MLCWQTLLVHIQPFNIQDSFQTKDRQAVSCKLSYLCLILQPIPRSSDYVVHLRFFKKHLKQMLTAALRIQSFNVEAKIRPKTQHKRRIVDIFYVLLQAQNASQCHTSVSRSHNNRYIQYEWTISFRNPW